MEDNKNKDGLDPSGIIERTGGRRRKLQAYSPPQEKTIEQEQEQSDQGETESAVEYPVTEYEPMKEKEAPKRKRSQASGYKETFLKPNELKSRQCVYISFDVHSVISKLVRSLVNAGNDISVGGYIDTVLNEHLQLHKEDINEMYRRQQGDLL